MLRKRKSRYELTIENEQLFKRISFLQAKVFGKDVPDIDLSTSMYAKVVTTIDEKILRAEDGISFNNDRIDLLLEHLKLKVKRQPKQWFLAPLKKKKN